MADPHDAWNSIQERSISVMQIARQPRMLAISRLRVKSSGPACDLLTAPGRRAGPYAFLRDQHAGAGIRDEKIRDFLLRTVDGLKAMEDNLRDKR